MFPFINTHPPYSPYLRSPYHHPHDQALPMYQDYDHIARDQRRQYYQQPAATSERGHRNARRSQYLPDDFDPSVVDDYSDYDYPDRGAATYHGRHNAYEPQPVNPYEYYGDIALGAQGLNAGLRELDRSNEKLQRELRKLTRRLEGDAEELHYTQRNIPYEDDYERRGRSRQDDDWTFRRVRPSKSRDSTRNRRASSRHTPQTDRIHDPLPSQRPSASRPTTPSPTMRRSVSRQSHHSPGPSPKYLHPQYTEYEQERYQRPRSRSRPREIRPQSPSPYVSTREPPSRPQSRSSHRQSLHDRTHSPHHRAQLAPPSPFAGVDQLERDRRPYASPRRQSTGSDQPKRQETHMLPEIPNSELEQFDEATKSQIRAAAKAIQDFSDEFAREQYEFSTPQVLDYQIPGGESGGNATNVERGIAVQIPQELSDFHHLPASLNDQSQSSEGDANPSSSKPKLAYTTRNVAIHAYMETLNKLLIKLDGVESWGSKRVRENRRQVVKSVEGEAKKLEDWIGCVWERYQRLSPAQRQQQQQDGQTVVRARAASESASKQREKMPSPRSQPLPPSTSPGTRATAMPTRPPGSGYAFTSSTCVDSNLDSDAPLTSDASPSPSSSRPLRSPFHLDRNSAGASLGEVQDRGMTNRTMKKGTDIDMGVDTDSMGQDRLETDRDMPVPAGEGSRMMMEGDGREGDDFVLIEHSGRRGERMDDDGDFDSVTELVEVGDALRAHFEQLVFEEEDKMNSHSDSEASPSISRSSTTLSSSSEYESALESSDEEDEMARRGLETNRERRPYSFSFGSSPKGTPSFRRGATSNASPVP